MIAQSDNNSKRRATKQIAMRGLTIADFETAYRVEYDAVTKLRNGPDCAEGPKAIAENRKRKLAWSNV